MRIPDWTGKAVRMRELCESANSAEEGPGWERNRNWSGMGGLCNQSPKKLRALSVSDNSDIAGDVIRPKTLESPRPPLVARV